MTPTDLKYARTHEWARLEGDVVTVGISHYAQEQLGDIVFVELPKVGKAVAKGAEAIAIESAKAAASIYSPVTGSVVEVNSLLADDPGLVNREPYGGGWIAKIRATNASDLDDLLTPQQYDEIATKE